MENTGKQAEFVEKRSGIADRRIAVAPMMDWTDSGKTRRYVNELGALEKHRSLYVASVSPATLWTSAQRQGFRKLERSAQDFLPRTI